MRIVYMGTPDFAVPALTDLYEAGHEILCVVSQPDKPVGRHADLKPTPVKEKALELGLKVLQPEKASDPAFIEEIRAMEPDVVVVTAYGKILRKAFLEIPKYGCINIHASLLPKYRGSAPIQWSVINGDEKTGITIMKLDEGMDTGDILLQEEIPIAEDETGGSLFDRLQTVGGPLCLKVLEKLEEGTVVPVKQNESLATKAPPLSKEMGDLDFRRNASELERLVRGLCPWPGTYTRVGGKILKVHTAHVSPEEYPDTAPGTFLPGEDTITVICGDRSALCLDEVQLEGKKRMTAREFLRGQRKVFETE